MEKLITLEAAKKLKIEGYSFECEWFYSENDTKEYQEGLNRSECAKNWNAVDGCYSAPTIWKHLDWLIGTRTKFPASFTFELKVNQNNSD